MEEFIFKVAIPSLDRESHKFDRDKQFTYLCMYTLGICAGSLSTMCACEVYAACHVPIWLHEELISPLKAKAINAKLMTFSMQRLKLCFQSLARKCMQ